MNDHKRAHIRRDRAGGMSLLDLARKHSVGRNELRLNPSTMNRIINEKSGACMFFRSRSECEQWAEDHARKNAAR